MKNAAKLLETMRGIAIIAFVAIICLTFAACGDDNCSHAWEWKITKAPTDFGDGEKTEICSKCKETRRKESILATGMVQIPAGTFTMGPDIMNDRATFSATLSAFKMSKYLITQEQYQEVMENNPSYFNGGPTEGEEQDKRPVETVSWYDAIIFCNKLSIKEGFSPVYKLDGSTNPVDWGETPHYDENWELVGDVTKWNAVEIVSGSNGYRLPTEAQWEYACRAKSTTLYYFGDDGTKSGEYAWYDVNSNNMTHEVGKKKPNAYGLYDMHGNVLEWCWDWWGYYPTEAKTDYTGVVAGTKRVLRGGSWRLTVGFLRSAVRLDPTPNAKSNYYGFRVARP